MGQFVSSKRRINLILDGARPHKMTELTRFAERYLRQPGSGLQIALNKSLVPPCFFIISTVQALLLNCLRKAEVRGYTPLDRLREP